MTRDEYVTMLRKFHTQLAWARTANDRIMDRIDSVHLGYNEHKKMRQMLTHSIKKCIELEELALEQEE